MDEYKKDNIDEGSSTGDNNRGKFSDRLKKMRMDRLKKNAKQENVIITGVRNVFKIFLAVPSVVYSVIKDEKKEDVKKANGKVISNTEVALDEKQEEEKKTNKRLKVKKIREMNVAALKKQKQEQLKEKKRVEEQRVIALGVAKKEEVLKKEQERLRIEKLQKEILGLIKKKLVKNINELEMLQSELFVLKEIKGDDTFVKDCQEDIKEIKRLLSKVKSLKEKYDYLKDTVDFEYLLEYGDDLLVEKILELKEICTKDDISNVIKNYKLLDEYKYLYLKIDQLQENTIKYDNYKREQELELKDRDINFNSLKNSVYDVNKEKERYENFLKKQELFLRELESKIHTIDSAERVKYKLEGFNSLVGNSFKYVGLMLMSPLKGLFPSIATQTVVTKGIIHNLYNNLEWEENKKRIPKDTLIVNKDSLHYFMNTK